MKLLQRTAAVLLALALALTGRAMFRYDLASAHVDPPGCRTRYTVAMEYSAPAGVHLNAAVTFRAQVDNSVADGCNLSGVVLQIETPDGQLHDKTVGNVPRLSDSEWFEVPYTINAADVSSNLLTWWARITAGSVHNGEPDGDARWSNSQHIALPPAINVAGACTVGATATEPQSLVVTGTTAEAPPASSVSVTVGSATASTTTRNDGSWSDVLPWSQPSGSYPANATVSYGNGNSASRSALLAINTIRILGGENPSTHDRTPLISGTSDAPQGTQVIVTVNGVSAPPVAVQADHSWSLEWPNLLDFGTTATVMARLNSTTLCASDTQSLSVVNAAPVATDDSYQLDEDSELAVTPPGVLANDSDPDHDPVSSAPESTTTHGSLTLRADGSFTYTPQPNFNGTDSFTYTISDGNGGTDTATVTLTVRPVNDPPDAVDDAVTVEEDSIANEINVLLNDSSLPDAGETLTITLVSDPPHGTAAIVGDQVTYTPDHDYLGSDSFTYTISDGHGGTDTATVDVTVTEANDPPDAVNDTATVPEDSGANLIDVLVNDSTAPDTGESLTITGVTDPDHGSVAIVGGQVSYTPDHDYFGEDSFTYTISDGNGGTDTATVTVTVTPVNDPPDAENDHATVAEDSGASAIDVLANDSSAPDTGESLTITAVTDAPHGTVAIVGGKVSYTPDPNFVGEDSFTYTISDGNGGTDTATVYVTVTPVNDPPDAVNDSATMPRNSAARQINVLANDRIAPDTGEVLTVVALTDPAHGSAAIVASGTRVTYTPAHDYVGSDAFTYTISDGNGGTDTATVSISVTPPEPPTNSAPVAADDAYTTAFNTPLTIFRPGVLANDRDPNGDALTADKASDPQKGSVTLQSDGSFTYTPNPGATGTDSFTYRASDGLADSRPATVRILISTPPQKAMIEGIVVDAATGEAIVGAEVKVSADFDQNGTVDFSRSALTGPDGRYSFEVPRWDWTYTSQVTALVGTATGKASLITAHRASVDREGSGPVFLAEKTIAGQVLILPAAGSGPRPLAEALSQEWKVAGVLLTKAGAKVDRIVTVLPDGRFEVRDVPPGEYRVVLRLVGPDGTILAGTTMPAMITADGQLAIGTPVIDPGGLVSDAVSGKAARGVTVTLYWADTELNREKGRLPDTKVGLPNLPNFRPGFNANPQSTSAQGIYVWAVYPDGDYYILAESDRYLPYDSRVEGRTVPGLENSVKDGVIHIGNAPLKYDFVIQPIHRRYMVGYPDGTFKPERSITRAEVAAILARNAEPEPVKLGPPPYADVPATHWAATYIELVRLKGYMFADQSGNFRPDQPITRAELASAVARFRGLKPSSVSRFPDTRGNWAEAELNAAFEAGLITGYPDGLFHPDATTRRDEAAAMINRMLGRGPLSGRPEATWPDVPFGHWASGHVEEASSSHSAVRDPSGVGERWTGDTGERTW